MPREHRGNFHSRHSPWVSWWRLTVGNGVNLTWLTGRFQIQTVSNYKQLPSNSHISSQEVSSLKLPFFLIISWLFKFKSGGETGKASSFSRKVEGSHPVDPSKHSHSRMGEWISLFVLSEKTKTFFFWMVLCGFCYVTCKKQVIFKITTIHKKLHWLYPNSRY